MKSQNYSHIHNYLYILRVMLSRTYSDIIKSVACFYNAPLLTYTLLGSAMYLILLLLP